MSGTRTAPTVGALTATSSGFSMHLIDASGDLTTEGLSVAGDGLLDYAEIEALVADYVPASNASIYKVTQVVEWEGAADPDNALALFRASVTNGINMLFKDVTALKSQTPRLVAPVASTMQGNQDIPIVTDAVLAALIAQYLTVLNLDGAYSLDSVQFTGRRERRNNPRIRT